MTGHIFPHPLRLPTTQQHSVDMFTPQPTPAPHAGAMGKPVDDADVHTVWLQVYKTFIEAVDAVDNGVNQFDTAEEPRYLECTALPARVGHLNPQWNEPGGSALLDERFEAASAMAGAEFDAAVQRAATSWLPARAIVERCLDAAASVHPSGAPLVTHPRGNQPILSALSLSAAV